MSHGSARLAIPARFSASVGTPSPNEDSCQGRGYLPDTCRSAVGSPIVQMWPDLSEAVLSMKRSPTVEETDSGRNHGAEEKPMYAETSSPHHSSVHPHRSSAGPSWRHPFRDRARHSGAPRGVKARWSGAGLALLATGLLFPAAAFPSQIDLSAFTTTQLKPDGSGTRTDVDSSRTSSAESYVEVAGVAGSKWFSSALAEQNGNLEVGVDNDLRTFLRGTSDATADLFLSTR